MVYHYRCESFKDASVIDEYLTNVMTWEGKFAQPGIAYDAKSGMLFIFVIYK